MIGRLEGRVLRKSPGAVLLDVGGVGYDLQIPLSTFYRLASANPFDVAILEVHTHVREGVLQLFGFATLEEREAFERLLAVSGVGPKVALAVLSGIGAQELEGAVRIGDRGRLERIPGIGKKTAERILLDLRDRLETESRRKRKAGLAVPGESSGPVVEFRTDAVSALTNLGYTPERAAEAVDAALGEPVEGEARTLESVLRLVLRRLVR
jgi:Holliday junction DNA helicase RuvA